VKEYFDVGIELRPNDVVLDVGANVGVFAMHAAKVEPSIHLVCVEPIPALFASLERNFETNPLLRNAKRTLHQLGLSDPSAPPEVEFVFFSRLPCDSTSEMDAKRRQFERYFASKGDAVVRWGERRGVGVLARGVGAVLTWMPKGRVGRWMGDRAAGAERVRCKLETADRLLAEDKIESVGLIKVDVEGAELKVLQGLSEQRWQRVRQVVLEGHDEDGRAKKVEELLARVGFGHIEVERPAIADERGLDNFLLYARRTAA
jgi:FkbM family methyltransferase